MRRETDGKDAGIRMTYLILDEIRAKDGGYVPCLVREGEKGYYLTNGNYGLDQERGQGNPRCICRSSAIGSVENRFAFLNPIRKRNTKRVGGRVHLVSGAMGWRSKRMIIQEER
jgi:hypothetical protein